MAGATSDPFVVLFNENRYDVKLFAKNHPGGVNTLRMYENRSVADGMQKFDHSSAAYHIMQDYKVNESQNLSDKTSISKTNGTLNDKQALNLNGFTKTNALLSNGSVKHGDEFTGPDKEEKIRERERQNEELLQIEALVDWSKPMLGQLHLLGADYERWVNAPVDRHLRLFSSPLMESLTFSPWYLVPTFWIPIISYLLYQQWNRHLIQTDGLSSEDNAITHAGFIFNLAMGVFAWTLIEYSIHRWIFHLDPGSSNTLRTLHFLLHGLHHKVPFDSLRLVFPPLPAAAIASFIYYAIVRHAFKYPVLLLTGGLIGYLTYDMIHAYIHGGSPEDGTYLYELKRYHANHHFVNSDKGFGISNKLWDHVFQTKIQLRKLGFSLRW